MNGQLLSVVIPTYNRASFLPACIRSVRASGAVAQIIVVDDGSTDGTAEVVASLGNVDYIWQSNAGVSAARNRGAQAACGDYVAFLDSDDTWRPGVAGQLIAALESRPEVEVAFADAWVHDRLNHTEQRLTDTLGRDAFERLPSEHLGGGVRLLDRSAFFRAMVRRNQVFLGSAIIRRQAVLALGGFDPELRGAADFEFMLRLAHRGPFLYFDQPLADYVKHVGSMSADLDHMDHDFALALRKVLEKCSLCPEERATVLGWRRQMLYYLAYNSYDRGDLALARRRLRELWREFGPDATSVALSALCRLPGGWVRRLRQFRRAWLGAP